MNGKKSVKRAEPAFEARKALQETVPILPIPAPPPSSGRDRAMAARPHKKRDLAKKLSNLQAKRKIMWYNGAVPLNK